jgi:bisphosphoglycerate-dependent phosphoglycerate mutase family 1
MECNVMLCYVILLCLFLSSYMSFPIYLSLLSSFDTKHNIYIIIERNYGALTGLNKTQTAERLGEELVQGWRGSLEKKPPPLDILNDPERYLQYYPGYDRKYADLTDEQIPLTESLMDCMIRTKPLYDDKIVYELKKGRNVLVVSISYIYIKLYNIYIYIYICYESNRIESYRI